MLRLPRRTVRLRLTLLYGALFLVSGAALLTITYLLVHHNTGPVLVRIDRVGAEGAELPPLPRNLENQAREMRDQAREQHERDLDQLLTQSAIALAIMSVLSVGLGWLMAGRVLRPLRTMTATTQRISEHNLHERLALDGPSDELKDLGDTIDGLLARLEAAFDAQRLFVANASHELRTPLAMMRTSLDVAAAKPGPVAPQLGALEPKLREGLDRADRLLESFLTLARVQHAGLPDEEPVPLRELVGATVQRRGDALAERGIRMELALADADVAGSRTLLAQLVENLVDNAIRHNEPWGWARVATRVDGERAELVVESGGPPLDGADVAALGQPFRRLGTARTGSENGVGLGLSIVAAIAAAHGGALDLEAREAGGLRVTVALPLARVPEPA